MIAFDYFIFFQTLEVHDVFFAQLLFQFCKPLFKIAGNSIYPVFDVVLDVRVGFVPFMEIGCIDPWL
jgi:hypothetical protein